MTTVFQKGDRVRSTAPGDDRRWRATVVEVGGRLNRIKVKHGKEVFWMVTDSLELVKRKAA
jgi:hypothetical protein